VEDTTLAKDHFGNIFIASDGVSLDCKGHTVSGDGSGSGIDLISRAGVTLKNCQVTGFGVGIKLVASSGNTLTKNTANGNTRGFELESSSDNTLTRNAACGNSDVDALQDPSGGNVFVDNDFCTTSGI
jgi:parallel beta-helix repeat protein